jgi:hypothetical protein
MGAPPVSEKDALLGLLASWCAKAKEYRDAHENARSRLRRWHYLLGVPAIVLSSAVAMAVFATLERPVSTPVAVGVGILSVGAAILAACQTFLRCSDRAEAHRQAASEYERIVDRAELAAALYGSDALEEGRLQELRDACRDVSDQMARVATTRPELAERDRRPPAPQAGKDVAVLPPRGASEPSPRTAAPPQPVVAARAEDARRPSPSSLPPAGASSSPPPSIPPPARLPLGTLPPVRAPQPHSSGSRSYAPPPVEEGPSQKPR